MLCATVNLILGLLAATAFATSPAVILLPQQMQLRPGVFTLCQPQPLADAPAHPLTRILVDPASQESGQYLAALLLKSTGQQFLVGPASGTLPIRAAILLTTVNANTNLGTEGYELTVAPDSIVVRAPAAAGVFYGVQSLLQLLPPEVFASQPVHGVRWTIPCVYIQDQPRFPWRGWMLDVSRHFFNKQEIKLLLDAMALHKLNTFHWHLVDDNGWRIEILKYPLLTQTGAWRTGIGWSLNPRASLAWNASGQYGGYYTQADIREVVAYAQQRHITIVPEIEMPGHSGAVLSAYPQYGPPGANIYSPAVAMPFLQDVLTEVMGLFPGKYIHTGGDEVDGSSWTTYGPDIAKMKELGIDPASGTSQYQHWFSGQIANFLQSKRRAMIGWSEIEYGGVLPNAALMDWLDNETVAAAQAGQYVVRSPNGNCYFDYYERTGVTWSLEPPAIGGNVPLSTVYAFEPVPSNLASQYTRYILGAQANTWCEYIPSLLNVEFKSYPRLCAMAELAWTPAASKNYTDFTNRLVLGQQRLAQMGVNYNRGAVPQIGAWTPDQTPTNYTTFQWDVTTNVTAAGEIDVSFCYTTGTNGLNIAWTALLENGTEIDRDTHSGTAAASANDPVYVLRLPVRKTGAAYLIRASVQGSGGTNSTGNVYLPNWD
jgi:hexosaminidase